MGNMGKNQALTLTIVARMTSNYSEGLGNIASVQKVFRDGRTYAIRSKESLKNAIMVNSGMYDDLEVEVDGVAQKKAYESKNAATCRALEGGYMKTSGESKIRKSSFYLTDAVACDEFVNETRFHNNLFLAGRYASGKKINLQENAKKSGLMPYQYEYDKSMKQYSLTIQLDEVGKDANFKDAEASNEEKMERVKLILNAVENLALTVKGNLDNAEPILVVGGIGPYKTHYFENVVRVERRMLTISEDLKEKIKKGYKIALLEGNNFVNEVEIKEKLKSITITSFFDEIKKEVEEYYGSNQN